MAAGTAAVRRWRRCTAADSSWKACSTGKAGSCRLHSQPGPVLQPSAPQPDCLSAPINKPHWQGSIRGCLVRPGGGVPGQGAGRAGRRIHRAPALRPHPPGTKAGSGGVCEVSQLCGWSASLVCMLHSQLTSQGACQHSLLLLLPLLPPLSRSMCARSCCGLTCASLLTVVSMRLCSCACGGLQSTCASGAGVHGGGAGGLKSSFLTCSSS
jgi:hypothetical protein